MQATAVPAGEDRQVRPRHAAIRSNDRGGRVLCEKIGPYLTRDASGGYSDATLHSVFRPSASMDSPRPRAARSSSQREVTVLTMDGGERAW